MIRIVSSRWDKYYIKEVLGGLSRVHLRLRIFLVGALKKNTFHEFHETPKTAQSIKDLALSPYRRLTAFLVMARLSVRQTDCQPYSEEEEVVADPHGVRRSHGLSTSQHRPAIL